MILFRFLKAFVAPTFMQTDTRDVAAEKLRIAGPVGWRQRVRQVLATNLPGVFDQGVVSATNFITGLVIGRVGGAEELGRYTLAFSLLVLLCAVMDSLVAAPYTILWERIPGSRRREYGGNVLLQFGVLLLALEAACVLLAVAAPGGSLLAIVLALAIPGVLLRHFARRHAFANLKSSEALLLDGALAVFHLLGLAVLVARGQLSATTALLVLAASSLLVSLAWLCLKRHEWKPRRISAWFDALEHWRIGRWLLGNEIVSVISGYGTIWVLAWMMDEAAAGLFTACTAVIVIANPFLLGVGNVLAGRAASAFASHGRHGLRKEIRTATVLYASVMGVAAVLGCLFGASFVAWLYQEPRLAEQPKSNFSAGTNHSTEFSSNWLN